MKIKNSIGITLLLAVWALPGHAQIGEQRQNFAVGFNIARHFIHIKTQL